MIRSIVISCALLHFLCAIAVYAVGNIYLEGMGAFTQASDVENQFGGGGALLYQISPDINVFIKNIFNTRKISKRTQSGERYYDEYDYMMSIAGVEYLYNINNMPVFWKSAFGIGAGNAGIRSGYDESLMQQAPFSEDTGLCLSLTTGMMFVFTQDSGGFFDIGYHKTFFFDEFEDVKIMGLQANIGVRFTLFGKNKSIYSEY